MRRPSLNVRIFLDIPPGTQIPSFGGDLNIGQLESLIQQLERTAGAVAD